MKKITYVIVLLFLVFICSACDGNVTRSIRHDGFSVGGEFVCDTFIPKDKKNDNYKKIKYLTGSQIIDENGKIYEISLAQPYANDSNCKNADTPIEVVSIFDDTIVKSKDGKYYYLTSNNQTLPYTEVSQNDNSYLIYDLLLKADDVLKVRTVDSNTGTYYVLKKDGNVYSYIVQKADRNAPPAIVSTSIVFNQSNYSGKIIDFNYAGDSTSSFVRSENKAYKMYIVNEEECSKYVDVKCKYSMKEFKSFSEYGDNIIAYNGTTLITDYGRIFNVAN